MKNNFETLIYRTSEKEILLDVRVKKKINLLNPKQPAGISYANKKNARNKVQRVYEEDGYKRGATRIKDNIMNKKYKGRTIHKSETISLDPVESLVEKISPAHITTTGNITAMAETNGKVNKNNEENSFSSEEYKRFLEVVKKMSYALS